jgi:hypothetical protein
MAESAPLVAVLNAVEWSVTAWQAETETAAATVVRSVAPVLAAVACCPDEETAGASVPVDAQT